MCHCDYIFSQHLNLTCYSGMVTQLFKITLWKALHSEKFKKPMFEYDNYMLKITAYRTPFLGNSQCYYLRIPLLCCEPLV